MKKASRNNNLLVKEMALLSLLILLSFLLSFDAGNADENAINELKETACNAAEQGNTCDTKLESLGLTVKEECCQLFGKCCL